MVESVVVRSWPPTGREESSTGSCFTSLFLGGISWVFLSSS
jgi:hypothetical protein